MVPAPMIGNPNSDGVIPLGLASMSRSPARDEHEHKTQDLGRAGSYAGGAVVGLGAARKPRGSRCLNCGAFPIHAPTTPLIRPLLPLFVVFV